MKISSHRSAGRREARVGERRGWERSAGGRESRREVVLGRFRSALHITCRVKLIPSKVGVWDAVSLPFAFCLYFDDIQKYSCYIKGPVLVTVNAIIHIEVPR